MKDGNRLRQVPEADRRNSPIMRSRPPCCFGSSSSSQHLNIQLARVSTKQSIHLIVDSTGLSIVGEGEWAAAKYGGRGKRARKRLHIGIDESGLIVAKALTHGSTDDAKTAVDFIFCSEPIPHVLTTQPRPCRVVSFRDSRPPATARAS